MSKCKSTINRNSKTQLSDIRKKDTGLKLVHAQSML